MPAIKLHLESAEYDAIMRFAVAINAKTGGCRLLRAQPV